MGTAIDFKKQMNEIVYINIPGPTEPTPGMSGGELLHGFLAELKKWKALKPRCGLKIFACAGTSMIAKREAKLAAKMEN